MVDPATHRLPVRAEIANADGELKPEMFASFRHRHERGRCRGRPVPESAVVYEGERAHVWVVRRAT